MYRTVVVPLDRNATSDRALAHGATLARQGGAELELVTERPAEATPDRLVEAYEHPSRGPPDPYLLRPDPELDLLESVHQQGLVARLEVLEDSDPATAILRTAAAPHTLVCLTTRARSALGEMILGSVSEQVVRGSRQPVVLIGPRCGPAPERYQSIVAGLDGSKLAEQIIPTVVAWSSGLGLTPWLFQALPADVPLGLGGDDFPDSIQVHRVADRLQARHHVTAEWDTGRARRPATAFARFAAGLPAPLIALTTKGRRGHGSLLMGSLALDVAHQATVPVLTRHVTGCSPS